jgi:gamma-glutamylcyclotransferase (GGCT)/AIG2-like uncharacterized protein YtfP
VITDFMPSALFIYGTLHPDRAPSEIAEAARRLKPIGRGTIRARLYNLGEYPGVILDETAPDTVTGEVFLVPDAATLARLDWYEDFRPDDPANSLFLRTKTAVTFNDGSRETCWVYVYNREPPPAPQAPTP